MTNKTVPATKGHILIVDDDPIVSGMLSASLIKYGFKVESVESGEACLERTATIKPDLVIMDIEMPGIDGYETCHRLLSKPETSHLPIIFLSSLESLEDRLRAYDAGAFDFLGKPFNAEVLRRKIDIALRLKSTGDKQLGEKQKADDTAMTAIFSLGELGVALKFTRDSLKCRSLKSLANLAISALKSYGTDTHVQIRTVNHGTITMTAEGPASPLEVSVIEMSRKQGRIFQFSKRLIVNYDAVSILILNLPTDNDEYIGRIRDYVAIITETAEAAVENILLRLDATAQAQELKQLAAITQAAIENLHGRYRAQQFDTRFELDQTIHAMEAMYVSLGLLESQEASISHLIHTAKENIMTCLEKGMVDESDFDEIISRLTQAANYSVVLDEDEDADKHSPEIDLW